MKKGENKREGAGGTEEKGINTSHNSSKLGKAGTQ
jgi:hypothetical protein